MLIIYEKNKLKPSNKKKDRYRMTLSGLIELDTPQLLHVNNIFNTHPV